MPSCPPLSCPARIYPFRVHCPSSSISFLTIRLALLILKPSAGATGLSADGAANPAHPTASPTGRRFCGALLSIVRERYADFGPTLAAEKLSELHGLDLGVETLRQWMIGAGIW